MYVFESGGRPNGTPGSRAISTTRPSNPCSRSVTDAFPPASPPPDDHDRRVRVRKRHTQLGSSRLVPRTCSWLPANAGGETRTPTGSRPPAPKAGVSTDSTTPARPQHTPRSRRASRRASSRRRPAALAYIDPIGTCGGGGTADAGPSKGPVRKGVWVRIPPAALSAAKPGRALGLLRPRPTRRPEPPARPAARARRAASGDAPGARPRPERSTRAPLRALV